MAEDRLAHLQENGTFMFSTGSSGGSGLLDLPALLGR